MSKKITIQARIAKELYLRNREMCVKELSEVLRLKESQIWREIQELARMGLISRRYEEIQPKRFIPPHKKVFIKTKNAKRTREVLVEKSML